MAKFPPGLVIATVGYGREDYCADGQCQQRRYRQHQIGQGRSVPPPPARYSLPRHSLRPGSVPDVRKVAVPQLGRRATGRTSLGSVATACPPTSTGHSGSRLAGFRAFFARSRGCGVRSPQDGLHLGGSLLVLVDPPCDVARAHVALPPVLARHSLDHDYRSVLYSRSFRFTFSAAFSCFGARAAIIHPPRMSPAVRRRRRYPHRILTTYSPPAPMAISPSSNLTITLPAVIIR